MPKAPWSAAARRRLVCEAHTGSVAGGTALVGLLVGTEFGEGKAARRRLVCEAHTGSVASGTALVGLLVGTEFGEGEAA